MTLHQIQVFEKVAKLGSFVKAAEVLRVRQPSVTLMIQSLQEELDVKLSERLGRKTHVTRAGEELLHRAERILTEVNGIKGAMDEIKGLKRGKLSVGGSFLASASFLPIAIQRFKGNYPGINVSLTTQRSLILEKKLLEGELDLGILSRVPQSSFLLSEFYQERDIAIIAPPNHPLTRKRSVPLKLIANEPLIVAGKGSFIRAMIERIFAERGLPFSPVLEVNLQLGIREGTKNAVANGLGVGFTTRHRVMADVEAGRIKVLKVPEFKLKRIMYIAVHKKRQTSPFVQTFIAFLKRYKD